MSLGWLSEPSVLPSEPKPSRVESNEQLTSQLEAAVLEKEDEVRRQRGIHSMDSGVSKRIVEETRKYAEFREEALATEALIQEQTECEARRQSIMRQKAAKYQSVVDGDTTLVSDCWLVDFEDKGIAVEKVGIGEAMSSHRIQSSLRLHRIESGMAKGIEAERRSRELRQSAESQMRKSLKRSAVVSESTKATVRKSAIDLWKEKCEERKRTVLAYIASRDSVSSTIRHATDTGSVAAVHASTDRIMTDSKLRSDKSHHSEETVESKRLKCESRLRNATRRLFADFSAILHKGVETDSALTQGYSQSSDRIASGKKRSLDSLLKTESKRLTQRSAVRKTGDCALDFGKSERKRRKLRTDTGSLGAFENGDGTSIRTAVDPKVEAKKLLDSFFSGSSKTWH